MPPRDKRFKHAGRVDTHAFCDMRCGKIINIHRISIKCIRNAQFVQNPGRIRFLDGSHKNSMLYPVCRRMTQASFNLE